MPAASQPPETSVGRDGKQLVDPSVLTTQQLLREMAGVRELFDAQLVGIQTTIDLGYKVIETRLNGMDTAIGLVRIAAEHMVASTSAQITSLREIHEEKFDSIQVQFRERDSRMEQNARDTKVAVDAALQAAEKAVGKQQESFALATSKSETATTKQIDQLASLIQQGIKVMDDKNNDLKERLTRLEGKDEGSGKQQAQTQTSGNFILALVGVVFVLLLGAAAIAVALGMRH